MTAAQMLIWAKVATDLISGGIAGVNQIRAMMKLLHPTPGTAADDAALDAACDAVFADAQVRQAIALAASKPSIGG